jgi:hypothetical protein
MSDATPPPALANELELRCFEDPLPSIPPAARLPALVDESPTERSPDPIIALTNEVAALAKHWGDAFVADDAKQEKILAELAKVAATQREILDELRSQRQASEKRDRRLARQSRRIFRMRKAVRHSADAVMALQGEVRAYREETDRHIDGLGSRLHTRVEKLEQAGSPGEDEGKAAAGRGGE